MAKNSDKWLNPTGRDEQELLQAIRKGDQEALETIYLAYRRSFVDWVAARYAVNQDEALDLYQELIIIFYENARSGKLDTLSSQLRTYLFGIGKILAIRRFHSRKRTTPMEDLEDWPSWSEEAVGASQLVNTEKQQLLRRAIEDLGETCRRLLLFFYYRGYSTEALVEEMGYRSADVLKSQKARCMRTLRQNLKHKRAQGEI